MPQSAIPVSEFAARRARAASLAKAAGLRGLIVCGRGGGALDRYGDVMYLTNFYSSFPFIPDVRGNWTARGHGFVLLTAEGEARLVMDCDDDGSLAIPQSDVVKSDLVTEAVVAAMQGLGLDHGAIGLVGGDTLPVHTYQAIAAGLPGVTFRDTRPILAGLRAIKSPGEIALMRKASALGSRMIDAMLGAAVPGANHGDIVAAGMQVLLPAGGMLYNSFMASGTGGDGSAPHWGHFPTWGSRERLREGQWFTAGISGMLDGYFFDLARSRPVGPHTNRQIDLFEAAIASVQTGVGAIRPGTTAEAVADAGLSKQKSLGFALTSEFSGLGHGLGMGWDSPWLAPGDSTEIKPGMVLCVERTVGQDGYSGDFEETVVVTDGGAEIITDARIRWW